MADIEILDSEEHHTPEGVPFVVSIVDDAASGDVKLVVMFEQDGNCAVLSLDRVLEEDISARSHPQRNRHLEERLREVLWRE
jgi:hypothetical protein